MRILMLAHRIPYPPHTGDKVRAYRVARYLAERHDLTLGFVVDDPADRAGLPALGREIGDLEYAVTWKPWASAKSLATLATSAPLSLAYFGSARLRRQVARRLFEGGYDLIYLSSSPTAQYVEGLTSTPVVMDFVDVDSDKWTQYATRMRGPLAWVYRSEGRRLRRYEARIAEWSRRCVVTTAAEESLLRSFAPWARTAVVPNGVDLEEYVPAVHPCLDPTMIFTGAMDYFPNVDAVEHFCQEIYPQVRAAVPAAKFLIVGLNPAPAVRRLAALPGVTVTGAVPDVRPYYGESSICVAPLRLARGVQNKVLQAMAMGLPVVATPAATQGLGARPGEELCVEGSPAGFARRVIELLRDPSARAALGARGRAFVEAHHSWRASLSRLHDLLEDVVAAHPIERRSSA
jgi:sugar transferase (PEP-CTERM/EpsH1 system associated)